MESFDASVSAYQQRVQVFERRKEGRLIVSIAVAFACVGSSPHNVRVCVQAGTQPWTVGVDLFDLAVQERFLVCMNLGYLLITFALYFFMRRREVRWGRLCLRGGNAAERAPCSLPHDLLDLPMTTGPQRRHPHRQRTTTTTESVPAEARADHLQSGQRAHLRLHRLRHHLVQDPAQRASHRRSACLLHPHLIPLGLYICNHGLNFTPRLTLSTLTPFHTPLHTQPSFICNSLPPGEHGLAKILCVFYLQKYMEYWDTYFFLLRRSFRQVGFCLGAGSGWLVGVEWSGRTRGDHLG